MENSFGLNIIPDNDQDRIKALRRYQILNTPPEGVFDNVARLATQIFKVPISLISLVDEQEVYFKANVGMGNARSTSRGVSLCSLAVLKEEVTVFENAPEEPCLFANPNVAGSFGLKFYAGAPITTADGFRIGTLCVIDKSPRVFNEESRKIMESLAKIVMDEIELRLAAMEELAKQKELNDATAIANEELQATNEELAAMNEEVATTNEELTETQEALDGAVRSLQDSEQKLKIAIETGKMGTWSIDTVTMLPTLSLFVRKLLGIAPEATPTMAMIMKAIKPEYHDLLMTTLKHALENGEPSETEYAIINLQSGEEKWVKATATILMDEAGKPAEYTGIIMDITEGKLDELRKNDFIGMVSHELKTPLTSLNAYLQMLRGKANKLGDTFTLGALDQSVKQVKRMTTLVNGFLNISRLESGKIRIDKQRFDMAELVKESEDETIPMYPSHHIIFAPVEETIVLADRDKIGQVVNNLISNAVKYSKSGSTVYVACVTTDGMAVVSVRDEGIGIEKNQINRLFERYYRVEGNHHVSGFGIGLYLAYEIIERHQGKIWARSEVGKGSTFFFSIPVAP